MYSAYNNNNNVRINPWFLRTFTKTCKKVDLLQRSKIYLIIFFIYNIYIVKDDDCASVPINDITNHNHHPGHRSTFPAKKKNDKKDPPFESRAINRGCLYWDVSKVFSLIKNMHLYPTYMVDLASIDWRATLNRLVFLRTKQTRAIITGGIFFLF